MKYLILTVSLALPLMLHAQSATDSLLLVVERTNTTLLALGRQTAAEGMERSASLALPDPEIGLAYLWGSPSLIGSRQDVSATQSLDLATLTGARRSVVRAQDALAQWQYRVRRMEILLQARLLCADVVYHNRRLAVAERRRQSLLALAGMETRRLEAGDGNRLEVNQARMAVATQEADIAAVSAEREKALASLAALMGPGEGEGLTLRDTAYCAAPLPADFSVWYAEAAQRSPLLGYVAQEVEVSRRQMRLARSERLPTLSAGFMGEYVAGQRYQGLSLGLSVPLWSAGKRIRAARAAAEAAEARQSDLRTQYYNKARSLYQRAVALRRVATAYRTAAEGGDSPRLLRTALDEGEISMPDYLRQMQAYYGAEDQALAAEHDYQRACAELAAAEL